MGQKIVFSGVAYGISFTLLSDEELEALLLELEEVDDVRDVEKVSELVDESYYEYGLLPPDEESLALHVDAEDKSELIDDLVTRGIEKASSISLISDDHVLVYEAREHIDFECEVDSFSPDKLGIQVNYVTLPNGEIQRLLTPYLDDAGFDPGGSTSHGRIYIIKKDGEEIDF